jgi:hypothetical protein
LLKRLKWVGGGKPCNVGLVKCVSGRAYILESSGKTRLTSRTSHVIPPSTQFNHFYSLNNHYTLPFYILLFYTRSSGSHDSVVGIATGYGLDDWGVGVQVPVGSRIFSTSSRPALGPTQPPTQWVPGALSLGGRGECSWGVKLSTHLQLVLRSRKCGSIHPLPHMPLITATSLHYLHTGNSPQHSSFKNGPV